MKLAYWIITGLLSFFIVGATPGTLAATNTPDRCEPLQCGDGRKYPTCFPDGNPYEYPFDPCTSPWTADDDWEPFSDIPMDHPNAYAIRYVKGEGFVSGYPDGTFRPNNRINRAEFVKIIIGSNFTEKALQTCDPNSVYDFKDASKTDWYAPYLCLAVDNDIIEGYADDTFRPEAPINFVEAAKIIVTVKNFFINGVRYDNVKNAYGVTLGPPLPESNGGPWYEPYALYLDADFAIPSTVSSLQHLVTRVEIAEIMWRLSGGPKYPDPAILKWRTYEELSGVKRASSSSSSAQMAAFSDTTLGIEFSYPSTWSKPVSEKRASGWFLPLGPVCKGCAEGEDTPGMYAMEMDADEARKLADTMEDKATRPSDTLVGNFKQAYSKGYTIAAWDEGGMCGYHSAVIFTETKAVLFGGHCLADSKEKSALLDSIAVSLTFK